MKLIFAVSRLIWGESKVLLKTIGSGVWLLICHFYMFMWAVKTPVVWALTESARIVLTISFGLLMIEAVAMFFHEELRGVPEYWKIPLPLWAKILVVLLALWMFRYKWKEMKSHNRAEVFLSNMAGLLEQIAGLNLVSSRSDEREKNSAAGICSVLFAFKQTFDKKVEPKLNLMMPNVGEIKLRIQHRFPPDPPYDDDAVFEPGVGGAGKAYMDTCAVYIPAIRYGHGIILFTVQNGNNGGGPAYTLRKELRPAGRVYKETSVHPYKSIISVPIRSVANPAKAIGVLNVDASKQDAFNRFDFDMAQVAANTIAMILDIKNSVP